MMIVRFHKLIQSRVVWYIILGVILIAFVGFFTPTMGGGTAKKPNEQVVGELFGREVKAPEYRRALQNAHIWYILSTGRAPQLTEELNAALRDHAWQQLVILQKAADEKIVVTDQEVVSQIQRMPLFVNQAGVFDANIYYGILNQLGASPAQVEDVIREQIAMQRLMAQPVQAALVAPSELEEAYHLYTDRLIVEYAVLPREDVAKEVTVSREEAMTFFEENKEAFRMPPKVRVSYVEFPVADFADEVELPEDAALTLYNQNIENYRIESTGDVAFAEYTPFEDVEEEITAELIQYAARRKAVEVATGVVAAIAPRGQGEKPNFAGAIAEAGLEAKSLPAFGPSTELEAIDPTAPFKQAAFGLRDDEYSSFSDAVVGRDSVYVLTLEQRYESFLPGFDAVEDKVMEEAETQAVAKALAEKALEIQGAVSEALSEEKTFSDVMNTFGLSVSATPEFDVSEELDFPYANELVSATLNVDQGIAGTPTPLEEGVLLSCVKQRTSLDAGMGLFAMRDELSAALSGARSQRLVSDWMETLVEEAGLKTEID
jgi:peptidyl-prolyl cis-trans isomerase D